MEYIIKKALKPVDLAADFTSEAWRDANELSIDNFRKESTEHHPETRCRVLYDEQGIYIRYQVKDQYVKVVMTEFQSSVCRDSCVEFFVEPDNKQGYFNFEFNAGGTFLLYNVIDPSHGENGFKDYRILEKNEVKNLKIHHTLPQVVDKETDEKVDWALAAFIPFEILKCVPSSGGVWRGNFYKCGGQEAHRHWASWSPVSVLNFHLPECFGSIRFE